MKSKTDQIRKQYNRIAFFYNSLEAPMEWLRFRNWRNRLKTAIAGHRALEVGVGTGKNLPYYPMDVDVTAIDFSPRMLTYAKKTALNLDIHVNFHLMDVQHLKFPDNSFDTVFGSFVFCSVPDPVMGLKEIRRVCKPGGRLLLLEHVRPQNALAGYLFDIMNPFVVRMMGANINRRTLENINNAGWDIIKDEPLSYSIVRWVESTPKT
ncbi:MAG: class I SAM-dependent methyltransferase [Deltaproteobacteria bacterium]|nr:class I SAM-dependent methyltransferase [Deltaproteobacteria bacterium]